jgi:serine/threonine protein kinase
MSAEENPSEVRLRELFVAALEKQDSEERRRYLEEACSGDPGLRSRVESLLRAHERADKFLDHNVHGEDIDSDAEAAGTMIGPYRILERLGAGGFGVVYRAEQTKPIRREVGLKVIKLGMDTKQVIARFEAERQALAMMDHPNIAKVLDAGTTETGRPYFVMELVRGIKITDYCDENRLSTRERLDLFVQVCHAIQHAHQKGIIHRDIKPSNILVTINDGMRAPKVIDFGIAKAIGQQLTDKTLFTAFEQLIGTPAYMSPEQAAMTSLDIDTRSDIYALGVLLYELLTGHTPFEQKDLVVAGLDEMRRIIREQEPIRPSTRLSTLTDPEQTTVAKRRSSEPPQLIHQVRGDLDWIAMKCLEKDRARRYETANGLVDDVTRHLNNELVSARPPSRLYRLQKLARRNQVAFAAGAAVAGALVIGLGLSTWLFLRERAAHARAVVAEKVQSQLRQQAQAEAQFFKGMLEGVGPSFAQGRDTTMVKEILDKAAERVRKDLKDQPEVGAELQSTIGDTYAAFGQYSNAEQMYRAALVQRRALWGNMNTNVADSLDSLGCALLGQNRIPEAEPCILESLTIRTNLLGPGHLEVAASLFHLGYVRYGQNATEDAEHLYRQSLAIRRKRLGNENAAVVESLSQLSIALDVLDRMDEAEAAAREALAIQARLPPDAQPSFLFEHPKDAISWVLFAEGRDVEAEPIIREQLERYKKLLGASHPRAGWSLVELALVLADLGKLDEAEAAAREALAISRKTVGDQHYITAWGLDALARTLRKTGRLTEAETAYREELAIWNKLEAGNAQSACIQLAQVLEAEGKQVEVETLYRQQLEAARKTPRATLLPGALATLANFLRHQARLPEAEALYRENVELARKASDPATLAFRLAGLGDFLRDQGKMAQAEPLYREGLDICRSTATNDFKLRQWLTSSLGTLLRTQGRLAEAESLCRETLQAGRCLPASSERARVLAGLADALRLEDKLSEAEPLYREGLDICRNVATNDLEARQWLAGGLGAMLRNQGRLAEAEACYRECVTNAARLWPNDPARRQRQVDRLVDVLQRQGKQVEANQVTREFLMRPPATNAPEQLDRR